MVKRVGFVVLTMAMCCGTSHAGFFKKVGGFFTKKIPGFFSCHDLVIHCKTGDVPTPTWRDTQSKSCVPRDGNNSSSRFVDSLKKCVNEMGGFKYPGGETNGNNFDLGYVGALEALKTMEKVLQIAVQVSKFIP